MEKIEIGKSPFSTIHHIGVIVKDLEKTVEFYESLGIGPFESFVVEVKERKLASGEPIDDLKLKAKQAHVGPIRIELIEPVSGKWSKPFQGFLERKGEGIAHIAFLTTDIEKDQAWAVENGVDVMYTSRFFNGGANTYFETQEIGGVIFELLQRPRDYVPHD